MKFQIKLVPSVVVVSKGLDTIWDYHGELALFASLMLTAVLIRLLKCRCCFMPAFFLFYSVW